MRRYNLKKTSEYASALSKYIPNAAHSNFKYKPSAIKFASGSGSRLLDYDGNEYLDLSVRSGAMIFGINNAEFNNRYDYIRSTVKKRDIEYLCSEAILRNVPGADMVRYGLSGTETIQNAMRLARAYTGRKRVVTFEGNYHGNHDNILGGRYNPLTLPYPSINADDPHCSKGGMTNALRDGITVLKWNDIELLENFLYMYHDEIAAVITEPIAVNAGSIMPGEGYLHAVRKLCDRYNIVLIFDEVITGNRTQLGSIQKTMGVKADLTVLGKALSGGDLPVTALLGSRDLMRLYENHEVIYGGTYNGYEMGLYAVYTSMSILSDGYYYDEMRSIAEYIHSLLKDSANAYNTELVIQGDSMCASFHCSPHILTSYEQYTNDIIFMDNLLRDIMILYGIYCCRISRMYPSCALCEEDIAFVQNRVGYIMEDFSAVKERAVSSSLKKSYKI
ncbi:MAG: aminotransferase class III-fold pyridoxal phosphate-dependent enzyme [Defluviitaleaceae bacterium]|nr:aminotransferase class III-fold pyridoxal phosphate-dependent enzyme [Defluviitaleaceae bacterium]